MTNAINTYDQQANDFLLQTGTNFQCDFLQNGKHFEDDKESRDIYKITLSRGRRKYSFKFGQSLSKSGFYYTKGVRKYPLPIELINKQDLATYIKQKIDWEFMNNGKSDVIHYPEAPTPYDILACLEKYPIYDFEDFCSNYGYDTDSRKAYKIYKAVKKESENVHILFTENELELLRDIS